MQTTYRLNASELDEKFLEGLKATFQGQEIEIIVYALDETEYLLSEALHSGPSSSNSHVTSAIQRFLMPALPLVQAGQTALWSLATKTMSRGFPMWLVSIHLPKPPKTSACQKQLDHLLERFKLMQACLPEKEEKIA
jgi:hypothetical protein